MNIHVYNMIIGKLSRYGQFLTDSVKMIENDKIHGSKNIFLSIHEWRSSCIICFKKEVHCSTIIGKGLLLEFYKKDSASQAAHDYDKTRNQAVQAWF